MTSLSEVYEGEVRTVVGRRRRWLGMALFALGVSLVVGAIALATTDLASWFGMTVFEARGVAGILAGLGLPAAFIGVFAVLPASSTTRAVAAIGASLAVFGVVLFSYAYPYRWISTAPRLALATTVIYALGTLITFWCLFIGLATFKTRNDPGGNARVELTDEGTVRIISTSSSVPGFSGVGLFGSNPDGDVPTQTNSDTPGGTGTTGSSESPSPEADDGVIIPEPTSDGGSAVAQDAAVDQEVIDAVKQRGQPDEYCGNCSHFEYVRHDGEIAPYCGFHRELLDDMDACDEWDPNQ